MRTQSWKIENWHDGTCYAVVDDMGCYVASSYSEERAQLIASAPELAHTLHELLWEMVTMADLINREDPGMMDAIKNHEFETDHVRACQRARELLARFGMTAAPLRQEVMV